MTPPGGPTAATQALARRLRVVQDLWRTEGPRAEPGGDQLFGALADLVSAAEGDDHRAWLLVVALTAAMPDPSLVHSVRRNLGQSGTDEAVLWLLTSVSPLAYERGNAAADLRIATEHPVVDVSSLLEDGDGPRADHRLLSAVVARWRETQSAVLVTWTARGGALRVLDVEDEARLLDLPTRSTGRRQPKMASPHQVSEIVVPWGVPVLVTGASLRPRSERLAGVARFTPSTVRLIGQDCSPVSSAETTTHAESDEFCQYLELVKHAVVVVGPSASAAAEFSGFSAALSAQGLTGPRVVSCPLPTSLPSAPPSPSDHDVPGRALVACVDHPDLRVDRTALLVASELLWREGLDFEVRVLLLGPSRLDLADDVARTLQAEGRPIRTELDPSESRIALTLAAARCLAYPSLEQGRGLPVIEALAAGTPVITSDFGSVREAAEGRGGLLIDPTDDQALADALRAVLTDDALHARLVAEAGTVPVRSVDDYADELWEGLLT